MGGILAVLLVAITFLSVQIGAVPSEEETVISQVARTIYGSRGHSVPAHHGRHDDHPHHGRQYLLQRLPAAGCVCWRSTVSCRGSSPIQGSRLVYSRGIVVLALLASAFIIVFDASVTRLIPLYAIGVFLSFTLSQAGMARRWWKSGRLQRLGRRTERGSTLRYERGWQTKMVINALGAVVTAHGHDHLRRHQVLAGRVDGPHPHAAARPALLPHSPALPGTWPAASHSTTSTRRRPRSVTVSSWPISGVHQGTLAGLHYAQLLSNDITAVHVSIDPVQAERLEQRWETWGEGVRLVVLESPYRLMHEPLLRYIRQLALARQPNEIITVVVPQFVPKRWFDNLLHTQTATFLRLALLFIPGVIVTDVPYQVD